MTHITNTTETRAETAADVLALDASFTITEDDNTYCIGLVIDMNGLMA